MLAISQTSSGCYCVEWSSTEDGPKIINHKHVPIYQSLGDEARFNKLISSINPISQDQESNAMSITLNSNQYILSQVKYDNKMDPEEFIEWYQEYILSDSFNDIYDIYYYPLFNQNIFITLSIMKSLKNKLIKNAHDIGYNLIYLSADIFSAAIAAKQLFKLDKKDSYFIWKIDKNNYHHLIQYKENLIETYARIKKTSNEFKIIIGIGQDQNLSMMKDFLYNILIEKKQSIIKDSIFLYQTNKSIERVKKILDINKSNIKLIDLSIITEDCNNSKINIMTQYSENGISLKGIDV